MSVAAEACIERRRIRPLKHQEIAANGFLLAAHIDALFDQALISLAKDGTILISRRVSTQERNRLRLPVRLRRTLTKEELLDYHRRHIYR
jgi:predicted restriction endonuclease